jgi:hypothetical protein
MRKLSVNFCALIESALIKITHAPLDYVREGNALAAPAICLTRQAGGRNGVYCVNKSESGIYGAKNN